MLFPFRDTGKSLATGTPSSINKVVYVHAKSGGKPTTFARKNFRSGTDAEFHNQVKILRDLGRHRHIVKFMGSYEHGYNEAIILHPAADGGTLDLFLRRSRQLNPPKSSVSFTDFGMTLKFSDRSGKTRSEWLGSIIQRFAAPEIIHGRARNVKTDMLAPGCVFAQVLAVLPGTQYMIWSSTSACREKN
jgi:hypothetical protein